MRIETAARLASFALLLFAAFACRYGRVVERAYSSLTTYIPWMIGLSLLAALSLVIFFVRSNGLVLRRDHIVLRPLVALLLAGAIAATVGLEMHSVLFNVELIHPFKYSLLSFFLALSFTRLASPRNLIAAFLLAAIAGVSEEGLQTFVPDRVFDLRDIALNVSGAVNGTFASLIFSVLVSNSQAPRKERPF